MTSRDKASKFVDLATYKRMNKAIKDLKLIGNLANRKNYEFTDDQVKKILKALQKEFDSINRIFKILTVNRRMSSDFNLEGYLSFYGLSVESRCSFSGIGGFCLGFEKNGIKSVWAVENDPVSIATYINNVKHVRILMDGDEPLSIENVSVVKHDLEPVDVLHAGFPCQSFSQAGGRKGFNDPRGRLFFEIIRIVKEFRIESLPY